jgi:hypothetical protein
MVSGLTQERLRDMKQRWISGRIFDDSLRYYYFG